MMKLKIRAVGKLGEDWQKEAVDIYVNRLKPLSPVEIIELPEGHGGSAKPDPEKTRKTEEVSLLKGLPEDAFVVALDETGKQHPSPAFADRMEDWSNQGARTVTFLIGGSWGLSDGVRKRANAVLSLGKLTLPHALARIVLIEQLYRAAMIRSGKTYHK